MIYTCTKLPTNYIIPNNNGVRYILGKQYESIGGGLYDELGRLCDLESRVGRNCFTEFKSNSYVALMNL